MKLNTCYVQSVDQDRVLKLLFGRPGVFRLACWVMTSEAPYFYLTEVIRQSTDGPSEIHQAIRRLTDLGLIERTPPMDGSRRQYYKVLRESPLWAVYRSAREGLQTLEAGHHARSNVQDVA
jgi:hypothetical protein